MTTVADLIRGTAVDPRPYQARMVDLALDLPMTAKFVSVFDRTPPANLDVLVIHETRHDAGARRTCTPSSGGG